MCVIISKYRHVNITKVVWS